MSWSTSELRERLAAWNWFKLSNKIFYWPFQCGTFCGSFMFLCLVFVVLSRLFIAALWPPAGKGLTSWLLFVMLNCTFVTFLCGILCQVVYLIVLIPDLCRLSYYDLLWKWWLCIKFSTMTTDCLMMWLLCIIYLDNCGHFLGIDITDMC